MIKSFKFFCIILYVLEFYNGQNNGQKEENKYVQTR